MSFGSSLPLPTSGADTDSDGLSPGLPFGHRRPGSMRCDECSCAILPQIAPATGEQPDRTDIHPNAEVAQYGLPYPHRSAWTETPSQQRPRRFSAGLRCRRDRRLMRNADSRSHADVVERRVAVKQSAACRTRQFHGASELQQVTGNSVRSGTQKMARKLPSGPVGFLGEEPREMRSLCRERHQLL